MARYRKQSAAIPEALPEEMQRALATAQRTEEANRLVADLPASHTGDVHGGLIAREGLYALRTAIEYVLSAVKTGRLVFKTGEGALTAMAQMIKLRSELVELVNLHEEGNHDTDFAAREERIAAALERVEKVVQLSDRPGRRRQGA